MRRTEIGGVIPAIKYVLGTMGVDAGAARRPGSGIISRCDSSDLSEELRKEQQTG